MAYIEINRWTSFNEHPTCDICGFVNLSAHNCDKYLSEAS